MAKKKILEPDRKSGDEARTILTATKLNTDERKLVQKLAYAYTKNGDLSTWMRHAILKWRPSKDDLVEFQEPEKK